MWAAQHFTFEQPNHWMTSGGLGTMGYGLPAAMGVQIAHPDALVIDIAGEASILMNIQEMGTLSQYKLPVKVFILNNEYMGMVRQWQELLHGSRYSESYSAALPDFVKLADAFHAKGLRAQSVDQLDDVIRAMIESDTAVIADIAVDQKENCYPMIPSGAAHNEMLLGPEHEMQRRRHHRRGLGAASDTGLCSRCPGGVSRPGVAIAPCWYVPLLVVQCPRTTRPCAARRSPSWSTTRPACWRASSACSPAAATTSTA